MTRTRRRAASTVCPRGAACEPGRTDPLTAPAYGFATSALLEAGRISGAARRCKRIFSEGGWEHRRPAHHHAFLRQRRRGCRTMHRVRRPPADTRPGMEVMTTRSHLLSRRTVLRGLGATVALPWLESLPFGRAADAAAAAPPQRFAVLFMGNGVNPKHWWAKGGGADMELSKSLQPLAPFRSRLNVVSGLFNKNATGVGIHPGQTGNVLSGAALQKGPVLHGGVSVDQVLAARFEDDTAQSSLVLGCEQPITGYHETNFSMAYSSHISWQDANTPVPMEVYPALAFDSLFA